MKRLEYIASGLSFLRLTRSGNFENETLRNKISNLFKTTSKSSKHHKFGLLFNAFTEKGFGEKFRCYEGYDSIHADSGGLQIITLGKTINEEMKDDVYRVQAASADYGMCFDDIPVGTVGSSSSRNDVAGRYFRVDELEACARQTGKNVKRQIEVFLESEGSSCRPILIAQGNGYDTYMKWVEYAMSEVPKEHHKHVQAVAMGAAALGTGPLEDIERAFIFSKLPIEKHHLHILGVGSVRRMAPFLIMMQSGLFDGVTVSYDSTTHTSGVEMGTFFKDGKTMSINRNFGPDYIEIFNDVKEINDFGEIDAKEFHKMMNTGFLKYIEDGGNEDQHAMSRISWGVKSIQNFLKHMDWMYDSKENLLSWANENKIYNPLKHLYNVKTKDDFDFWVRNFGKSVKSSRVQSGKPSSLEGFF